MRITLDELKSQEHAFEGLLAAAGVDRDELAVRLGNFVTIRPAWTPGQVNVEAGQRVGTMQIGDLRIDVRPRLAAAEMATLIRYAYGGAIDAQERSNIATAHMGLDELICSVLVTELSRIRQAGLSRNYVERREKLNVLRGRPDFLASFPWNDRGMTSLGCRHNELTCDNLDNQIVLACLERATLMRVTVPTRRRILEHRQVWAALTSSRAVGAHDFVRARSRYNRLSAHYRLVHNLAELILLGHRPSQLYDTGPQPSGGIVLGMPELFELFVERLATDSEASVRRTPQPAGRGAAVPAAMQRDQDRCG